MASDHVQKIGIAAYRYLMSGPRAGRVVSQFRHGSNALFEPGRDPALLSFQVTPEPLHPWAIEIPSPLALSRGLECRATSSRIVFDRNQVVQFNRAQVRSLEILAWRRRQAHRALARIAELQNVLNRFMERWNDFSTHERDALVINPLPGDEYGNHLMKTTVGRGKGSTPSGDDYIVGQLAVLWALSGLSPPADRQIRGMRSLFGWQKLNERTPLGSAQMLSAAIDGHFSSTIRQLIDLIASPQRTEMLPILRQLLQRGSSSGTAMLAGAIDGLRRAALWYVPDDPS